MIKNYFKTAWRSLVHNKSYTIINIAGLAVSITACILTGIFVYNEISFDKNLPDKDDIYRLNEYIHYDGTTPQLSAASGPPIAAFLKNNHSEIESYARVFPATPFIYPSVTFEYDGKKIKSTRVLCTDTTFAGMFNINIVEGNKSSFIQAQNSIVLSQSLASKLFGNTDALNKTLIIVSGDTSYNAAVCNVIKDFPQNSHLQFEALLPIPRSFEQGFLGDNYGVLLGPTYLKLKPNIDAVALQEKLSSTLHSKNKFIDMRLQPLTELHSGSMDINYDYLNYKKIDGKYIRIFIIIALAIFIIACINFINLTVAVAAYRGKEIAVKKLTGASRAHIILQVLAETFLSILLAVMLSFLLSIIFLPFLNKIIDRQLTDTILYQPPVIGIYLGILVFTTLLAGLYPALLISSAKINRALKSKVLFGSSRTTLRNVLVTGQFTIAVIFIVSLLVFLNQLKFIQNKDLGYSYNQVIKVPLDVQSADKMQVLQSELTKIEGVTDVSHGFMEMGGKGSLFGIDYIAPDGQNKHVSVNFENAATNYVSFFGMKIIAGRDFNKSNAGNEYLINETLARQIGYDDPIGKPINLSSFPRGSIVGVVKDFNYSSLHSKIEPLLISAIDNVPVWQSQLYIKVTTTGITNTLKKIEAVFKSITGDGSVTPAFLDEHFRQVYASERQAEAMIAIIGGLAILIACLGLLSLSAFIIIRRAKEIGIRKVLGASAANVVGTLSKEFIALVIIAFVLATPVAWWLMDKWLQSFAYRIDIRWWMFVLAGVITTGIAFLTVSFQAIKAAIANPVKSLRTE